MYSLSKKRGLSALLSMLLVLSIILTACSSTGASSNTGDGKSDKIRIGYQKNGPLFIMKHQGTLEKRLRPLGVSVEWYEFQSGPPLLESLNAGSLDFGRTGDAPPIFAQASGSKLVYTAVGLPKSTGSGLLVKKDSAIQKVSDLKGKTVGFSKGSSSHYFLAKALQKEGLSLSDIKPAYLSPGDARVAFEQGKIDAWLVWDPFTADAETTGNARTIATGEGYTTDRDIFLSSESYAKEHGDILKVVIEEIQKTCEWANQHPEELTDLLSSILGIDKASIKLAVERREYGLVDLNKEIIAEQQDVADTFYELKIIPKQIHVEERFMNLEKKDEGK